MTIYGQGQQYSGYSTPSSYSSTGGSTRGSGNPATEEESAFSLGEGAGGGADSVSLSSANQALIMADDNRDGLVDRQEVANASYQLLSNENASEEDIATGNLFATFVLGGQSGEGLFPDINQDGGITGNELALLARGDNDTETISSEDFALAYGDEVNPEGSSFTLEDLEAAASGQAPGSTGEGGIGNTRESSLDQPASGEAAATESLVSILGSITELLGLASGGQQTPAAGGQQTPAAGGQQTPAAGGQQTPAAGGQQTPAAGGQQTPAAGGQQTPAAGGQQTPAAGGQQASANPATAIVSIITSLLTLLTSLLGGQQKGQAAQ